MDTIIGFGISGLLWKYYYPKSKVYYAKAGGTSKILAFAPRLLHATKETKRFIEEIGLDAPLTKCPMGYFYDGSMHRKLNSEHRKKMVVKKMNLNGKQQRFFLPKDLNLSTMKNYIPVFDTNIGDLFSHAIKKMPKGSMKNVIEKKVILINTQDRELVLDGYVEDRFDRLVSTIPAPDFEYLAFDFKFPEKLEYLPVTYMLSDHLLKEFDDGESRLMYIIDEKFPFTRVSRSEREDGKFVYEMTGIVTKGELLKLFDAKNILDINYQRIGVIKTADVKDTKSLIFLGRHAQWHHAIKVQDVLKKIYSMEENKNDQVRA